MKMRVFKSFYIMSLGSYNINDRFKNESISYYVLIAQYLEMIIKNPSTDW